MIYIRKKMYNQLIEWAMDEKPFEAAGYLFKDNSIFKRIITDDKSPAHFLDNDPVKLLEWIEKYGRPNIFHSHPCAAVPSGTDIKYMKTTIMVFKSIWFIMSDKMVLRAWTLDQYNHPVEIEVEIID